MKIVVNGTEREIPDSTTVRGLVELLGLAAAVCAVEVNRCVVPRRSHESTALRPGDRVEVVSLVGGG